MHVLAILDAKGRNVTTTRPEETIAAAARLLDAQRIGAAVVVDGTGEIVGILSERDIVAGLARHGSAVCDMRVADLMTRELRTCGPEDSIESIMAVMTGRRVRHLPVLEDGKLAGIVSIGDVVKHRLDETAMEVDSLRQYVLAGR